MERTSLIHSSQLGTPASHSKVVIGPKSPVPAAIQVHKDGELIRAIEIRCKCGETIIVQCDYE